MIGLATFPTCMFHSIKSNTCKISMVYNMGIQSYDFAQNIHTLITNEHFNIIIEDKI